jgi:RNA polymerase-binding transcription factor DksA
MRTCIVCNKDIPQERLEILPHTKTCVNCSTEEAKVGFTVWDKKTPELMVIDSESREEYCRYDRGDGRLGRL